MWIPNIPVTVLSATAATAGIVCIFKDMYGGPAYDPSVRADGKTVIVTGANTGIGRETALEFAKRGAKVFMACRDMAKCEVERQDIVLQTENKYVYCRPCDLASLQSVREFVARFKSEEPHLHVLVNNAGVMMSEKKLTKDGFEMDFGVNHLGHFLLTALLMDTLKSSAPSRVVVVSDGAHRSGRLRRDLSWESEQYESRAAYAQSKLANLLHARELARRLLDSKVSVVAVDPGLSDTGLSRQLALWSSVWRAVVYPVFWPLMKRPRTAAQVVLHAALDPGTASCAGDYYKDMELSEPSEAAQDYALAAWLWKVSEKWTRLEEHQKLLAKAAAA